MKLLWLYYGAIKHSVNSKKWDLQWLFICQRIYANNSFKDLRRRQIYNKIVVQLLCKANNNQNNCAYVKNDAKTFENEKTFIHRHDYFSNVGRYNYVTRDDSQRRFLEQPSVETLLRHCFKWLQHCSNIATLCCAKNCCCESSRVTSP